MAWEQLLSIMEEAQADHDAAASTPPEACPQDGWPLQEGPDGVLHCLFDGWTYEQ